ncbi:hypothetical protein ABIC45_004576 [Mucilaginibacter rubeus]|uniref:hypothetical protein n=1 Tax=Mucilaginibacter TaxID=423349 RepID=UPI0008712004|nr:hypothetical protein [Mucilaginibacter sp. NFR10]SCW85786.1 hypothetical protein SAMN03159284_05046 [Mucilaginibacter sp. NFR10]
MKIITLHTNTDINQLYQLLHEKLNPMFHRQRQSDLNFTVERKDGTIEISLPAVYEGALFSIAINGNELWITRNEHYVDDVNSLTVESILNDLFSNIAGNLGTDLVQEG